MAISTCLSIMTLNINGLNSPIKRQRVTEWIKKSKIQLCTPYKRVISDVRTHTDWRWSDRRRYSTQMDVKSWSNSTHIKIDFKTKTLIKKSEHYITIKESIQQEDITFAIIYAPNIGTPKYIKQIWVDLKGEIDSNTIIVGDFSKLFTSMDRSSRQTQ